MPKKTINTPVGPTMGQVARLLADALDLQVQEFVQGLVESQDDLKLDTNMLKDIRDKLMSTNASVKSRATDQLQKYF
tara:strand:- start:844 stop:1074 length:231 start_codon:yes stop_codon:yes gene_type:complete